MQLHLIHTTCKLKKLFPCKDKQPHLQKFDFIYQLKCDCDNRSETIRPILSKERYINTSLLLLLLLLWSIVYWTNQQKFDHQSQ